MFLLQNFGSNIRRLFPEGLPTHSIKYPYTKCLVQCARGKQNITQAAIFRRQHKTIKAEVVLIVAPNAANIAAACGYEFVHNSTSRAMLFLDPALAFQLRDQAFQLLIIRRIIGVSNHFAGDFIFFHCCLIVASRLIFLIFNRDEQHCAQRMRHIVIGERIFIASCTFDSLPHNGAIITLLTVCGFTHKEGYLPIFMLTVVTPFVGMLSAIAAAGILG